MESTVESNLVTNPMSSKCLALFSQVVYQLLKQYLDICLRVSKSQADKTFSPKDVLKLKMREIYLKESDNGKRQICTKEELVEFLEDGNLILDYFQKSKNFNKFFTGKLVFFYFFCDMTTHSNRNGKVYLRRRKRLKRNGKIQNGPEQHKESLIFQNLQVFGIFLALKITKMIYQ